MSELNLTDIPGGVVPLTPILTDMWGEDRSWTLDAYRARGGYQGWEKAKYRAGEIWDAVLRWFLEYV